MRPNLILLVVELLEDFRIFFLLRVKIVYYRYLAKKLAIYYCFGNM